MSANRYPRAGPYELLVIDAEGAPLKVFFSTLEQLVGAERIIMMDENSLHVAAISFEEWFRLIERARALASAGDAGGVWLQHGHALLVYGHCGGGGLWSHAVRFLSRQVARK